VLSFFFRFSSFCLDVPLENLAGGDTVRVHYRVAPYFEKLIFGSPTASAANPLTLSGVLGPGGERPILDGDGATTRTQLSYTNEVRGLIKIGTANTPSLTQSDGVIIENLELRNAGQTYQFTGDDGTAGQNYAVNAAGIYVEAGSDLIFRNNVIRTCGNGIFVGYYGFDIFVC
jgi:hypothetical protein